MPTLGNHENEPGNGPQGYLSYQTRFTLPKNGSGDSKATGTASKSLGAVRHAGQQRRLLPGRHRHFERRRLPDPDRLLRRRAAGVARAELRKASIDLSVDWIVAVIHQPAMSTSDARLRPGHPPELDAAVLQVRRRLRAGRARPRLRGNYLVAAPTPTPSCGPTSSAPTRPASTPTGLVHLVVGTGGTKGHDDVYRTGTAGEPTRPSTSKAPRTRPRTRRGPPSPPQRHYPWGLGVST